MRRRNKDDVLRRSYETTKYFLITDHYASRREELEWDVNRYRRLCSALQLTEEELGAFIRINPAVLRKHLQKNKFPPPIELHLSLIERSVLVQSTPPLFPKLP